MSISPTPQADPWPNIAELLDKPGGHISIGRMPPIEGAAIVINDQTLLASLVRREGKTFLDLLKRLDAAIGKGVHEGAVTNDITAVASNWPLRASAKNASRLGQFRAHLHTVSPGLGASAMRPGPHGYMQ